MNPDRQWLLKLAQEDPSTLTPDEMVRRDRLGRMRLDIPLVMINRTMAGRVAGAEAVWEAFEAYGKERSLEMELCDTGSMGLHSEEPIVSIQMPGMNRLYFSGIRHEQVAPLMDDLFHMEVPGNLVIGQLHREGQESWAGISHLHELPFFALQKRITLRLCGIIDPFSLEEYIATGGYASFFRIIREYTFEEVCDLVTRSGLRGRAGGGYLTGEKWKAAYQTSSDQKYLICNAEESDPGAFMDRTLMEGNPFQLLEGIAIAAYAISSNRAYIYIRSEYTDAIERIGNAIRILRETGLLGDNILDSGYNLQISLRKGPGAFVCGEETALIASLEGKRGMPASKPPYPTSSGYLGHPTVVNNVETLSTLPAIIRGGPGWFSSIGMESCTGTKIFSISGKARMTGLVEVPMGTTFQTIIHDIAGGTGRGRKLKAIHVGGPSGCLVPPEMMHLPVCYETLKSEGLVMGSGGILVLDDTTCVVNTARYFMEYEEMQSCGKCIPCREGTRQMADMLRRMTRKPVSEETTVELDRFRTIIQIEKLAEVMRDTSLCGLGQNAPNPVMSSLRYFRKEFEAHLFDSLCSTNSCRELRSWHIDVDLCTGCSICAKRCPAEAIIGTPRHPYFIVQEKCISCGICFEVCKFSAVYHQ